MSGSGLVDWDVFYVSTHGYKLDIFDSHFSFSISFSTFGHS